MNLPLGDSSFIILRDCLYIKNSTTNPQNIDQIYIILVFYACFRITQHYNEIRNHRG